MRVYLLMMLLAATITYVSVPVARRVAIAVGAITQVRARDVHKTPIPRLGGLAMYGGLVVTFVIASHIPYLTRVLAPGSGAWGVLLGAGIMCLVGVIDDIWELVWYAKLAGEMLAAGVMAWKGVTLVSVPFMGLTVGSSRLTLFVTIMIVVVVANAVNFVDGLDGLAAGIVAIAAFSFFIYSYYLTRNASPGDYSSVACAVVAGLVGICVGFLPHNFHPARIFMGDSGALMLGVVIAGAGILVTGQIDPANTSVGYSLPAVMPLLVPAAVILLPLIDFIWAVVRRMARGQSPFHADAGHLHHRLLRRGHSHAGAVLILYLWAAIASLSCVAFVIFPAVAVAPFSAVAVVVGIFLTHRELGRKPGKHRPRHSIRVRGDEVRDNKLESSALLHERQVAPVEAGGEASG
ncbi:undecaprenyl/decaprenyl-phosphate alpha-N-acetylglucosaminyl 1-phosphate transferase [Arcanobacterium haemolyticum]|nr:undecaprenyl/decaprenyl-phosphate alpha-N-acetylglucosaminyl 1-phosphate transferase [Arcanobacterium haemolyticum]